MTRTGEQAIAEGWKKKQAGYSFPANSCLKQIRLLFDIPSHDFTPSNGRDPWAIEAFDFAKMKFKTSDPMSIPRGVPVFWRRAGRPGHIALSLGGGKCLTTDKPTSGRLGIVTIDSITKGWGMTLVGYTRDLNTVVIPRPAAAAAPKPAPKPALVATRDRFAKIDDLAIGLIHDTKAGTVKNKSAWKIHESARAFR